jgi:HTH-type transcriptional regulator/antitoxin HipB
MDYPVLTPAQLRPMLVGFRKSRALTQTQLAKMLGMTQQTYARLEAAPERSSAARLLAVLQALGVTVVLSDGQVSLRPDQGSGEQW